MFTLCPAGRVFVCECLDCISLTGIFTETIEELRGEWREEKKQEGELK